MPAKNVQMARFKVKPERATEFEEAAKRLFADIQEKLPDGMRYTLGRLSDGVTYVGLLELDDGIENPLPGLPEGKKFLESLPTWAAEPPARDQLTVIGSYRFF
jgi:hypothetical protein